ncbi:MAG: hypothetical protein JW704_05395 [Anaerolineaceae bacterium]|nr:hypothetical protein [Anaerolineaceae bacterium]
MATKYSLQHSVVKNYFITMNAERLEKQLLDLKKQISDLGIPIPGSIQTMYLRCGKKNCRCHQAEDLRHGPYYLWYRRINGKTTTQSIAEKDVHLYRTWIDNRNKMEALVQKMVSLGADYAAVFKTTPGKSKKSVNPMRGM